MMNRTSTVYHGDDVVETTQIDVTWVEVRAARNRALADSDWTAVKDRTMSQAWKDYRTALRDLPQEHDEANDAADAFPEAPA